MSIVADAKLALRSLRRRPGPALAAVAAFAIGIGFNSAVFSSVEVLLLRPLLIPDADRVVSVTLRDPLSPVGQLAVSWPELESWRKTGVFENLSGSTDWIANLTGPGGEPQKVTLYRISQEYFPAMKLAPALGAGFSSDESRLRQVIFAWHVFQARFQGNPAIVGKTIELDGAAYTIAGVMPLGFRHPLAAEGWTLFEPSPADRASLAERRFAAVGRLRDGVSIAAAQAAVVAASARLAETFPRGVAQRAPRVELLREGVSGELTAQYSRLALASVLLLLLIACVNVANLQFSQSAVRLPEFSLRSALGANPLRLLRLLLIENLMLASAGAIAGLFLAAWCLDTMRAHMPAEVSQYLPGWYRLSLSPRVLLYSFAITLAAALTAGILPAWLFARRASALIGFNSPRLTAGRSWSRLRAVLVAAQVALAVVLLTGALLVTKGFRAILTPSNVERPDSILSFRVTLNPDRANDPRQRLQFWTSLQQQLAALPGATSDSSLSYSVPYGIFRLRYPVELPHRSVRAGEPLPSIHVQPITPGYLPILGIPVLKGRGPHESDGPEAPRVAFVSQSFVKRWFEPNEDPLGREVVAHIPGGAPARFTIAGVTGDSIHDFTDRTAQPVVYVPLVQSPPAAAQVLIRSQIPVAELVPAARRALAAVDSRTPMQSPQSYAEVVRNSVLGIGYIAAMLSVTGGVALFLAALGVFSLLAQGVNERIRELGIRMALGADREGIARLVLRSGLRLTLIGLALGLPASFVVARLLSSLLFGVSSNDLPVFFAVPALLLGVTALAVLSPLRRVLQLDPVQSLRHD